MRKLGNEKVKIGIATIAISLFLTGCAAGAKYDDSKSYVSYIGNSNFVEHHEDKDYFFSKLDDKKENSTQCLIQYKSDSYQDVVDGLNSIPGVIKSNGCDALGFYPNNNQNLKGVPDEAFSRLAVAWDNRTEKTECKVAGGIYAKDSNAYKDLVLNEIAKQYLPSCKSIEIVYESNDRLMDEQEVE